MGHETCPQKELDEAVLLRSKSFFIKEPLNPIDTTHKREETNHMTYTQQKIIKIYI